MKFLILFMLNLTLVSYSFAGGKHDGGQGHKGMKMDMGSKSHWMSPDKDAARVNPVKSNAKSIAQGLALYKKNCVSCHGANAKGDGPAGKMLKPKPADLASMAGGHPDGDFAWKISAGRGAMPPWKNILSENEIWAIVNYIQSLAVSKATSTTKTKKNDHDAVKHAH